MTLLDIYTQATKYPILVEKAGQLFLMQNLMDNGMVLGLDMKAHLQEGHSVSGWWTVLDSSSDGWSVISTQG